MRNLKATDKVVKPSNTYRILSLILAGIMPSLFLAGLTMTLKAGQIRKQIDDEITNNSTYQQMLNYEIDKQYNNLKNEDITYDEYFSELKNMGNSQNYNGIFEKSDPALYEQYQNTKVSETIGATVATTAGVISTIAMFYAVNEAKKLDEETDYASNHNL